MNREKFEGAIDLSGSLTNSIGSLLILTIKLLTRVLAGSKFYYFSVNAWVKNIIGLMHKNYRAGILPGYETYVKTPHPKILITKLLITTRADPKRDDVLLGKLSESFTRNPFI